MPATFQRLSLILAICILVPACRDEENSPPAASLQLFTVRAGTYSFDLNVSEKNTSTPIDKPIVATFSAQLNQRSVEQAVQLKVKSTNEIIPLTFSFLDNNQTFSAAPATALQSNQSYILSISDALKGAKDQIFSGYSLEFKTIPATLQLVDLLIADRPALSTDRITEIPVENLSIVINFSAPLDPATIISQNVNINGDNQSIPITITLSDDGKKITLTGNSKLKDWVRYQLVLSDQIKGKDQETFQQYVRSFYSGSDSGDDFPVISDDDLLSLVQQQTFKFFYDFAHPVSGMARERNTSGNIVTTGGSGFGIMSLIVGMERSFISRQQGVDRMNTILTFLESADRFHGAWPHWLDGSTGKVIPFSAKDNGGDLVETSFLMQGLLTFRQYMNPNDATEQTLINRINALWQSVEWDWYRKNNENVLYWHWSPSYDWQMNFPLYGYFEEQITYVLAASSPTHSIPKLVYTNGYGKNGTIVKNNLYYGYKLPLESPGPLFWVHYSYIGLNPHFTDDFANYWEQNVNSTLINYSYCVANPKNYVGYSSQCWGLTASDNQSGYGAHSPSNDLGVIAPTAALSSFPYTPVESMRALKFFYYKLGDRLWGPYGFYDAFNLTEGWTASSYLAIDQGPIIVMIENYRTGLLWNLFMSASEVKTGMDKLGFQR
jgi:hypothetical protein